MSYIRTAIRVVKPPTTKTATRSKPKRPYGYGRVQFLARLSVIRDELRQGFTLRLIYERHRRAIDITYSSFAKLVARYASDARPYPVTGKPKDPGTPHEQHKSPDRVRDHSARADPALIRKLTRG